MKTFLAFFCLLITPVRADLSTHPVFKHYLGRWKASGELKGEDGKITQITEEWIGTVDGETGFLIEGTRTMNDDTQPFQWRITRHAGADHFEAVLGGRDGAQTLRFEGNVSTVNLTLELRAVTGNGSSSITVLESFPTAARDVIEGKVTFTGESGQTTLQGIIKHEKQKAP